MRSLLARWRRSPAGRTTALEPTDWSGWILPRSGSVPVACNVLPTLGIGVVSKVTASGAIVSMSRGVTVSFWIGAGDRWICPETEATVRQSRVEGLPVVETRLRVGEGDVVWTAWADEPGDGHGRTVVEVTSELDTPVVLGVAVRPFGLRNGEIVHRPIERIRVVDDLIVVDGMPCVRLPRPAADAVAGDRSRGDAFGRLGAELVGDEEIESRDGSATMVAMLPLTVGSTALVEVIDGRSEASVAPAPLDATVAGWRTHLERTASIALPQWPKHLWPSLTSGILAAATDPTDRPIEDHAFLVTALDSIGLRPAASDLLDRVLDRADRQALGPHALRAIAVALASREGGARLGRDHGPITVAAAGPALAALPTGDLRSRLLAVVAATAGERAAADAAQLTPSALDAHELDRLAFVGAELPPAAWQAIEALPSAGRGSARELAHELTRSARQSSPTLVDHVTAVRSAAGGTWRWPNGADPDSAVVRAALALALHRVAVRVDEEVVDLVPGFVEAWLGHPIDVSGLVTPSGTVSFALRWHGERPALLWEIDAADERSPTVRCSSLDPSFSSTDPTGEALLAIPPIASNRLAAGRKPS